MHVQPYQQVWRRVAVACTVPLHREPAAAALGLVRLILLMAALPMIGMVVATPIRPRGRGQRSRSTGASSQSTSRTPPSGPTR